MRAALALGDPAHLHLAVSHAAERLSGEGPVSRRDRKSGAKTRWQAATEVAGLAARGISPR